MPERITQVEDLETTPIQLAQNNGAEAIVPGRDPFGIHSSRLGTFVISIGLRQAASGSPGEVESREETYRKISQSRSRGIWFARNPAHADHLRGCVAQLLSRFSAYLH